MSTTSKETVRDLALQRTSTAYEPKTFEELAQSKPQYGNVGKLLIPINMLDRKLLNMLGIKLLTFELGSGVYTHGIVITTAHNFPKSYENGQYIENLQFTVDYKDRLSGEKVTKTIRGGRIFCHPNYQRDKDVISSGTFLNNLFDIAVIEFDQTLDLDDLILSDSKEVGQETYELVGYTPFTPGTSRKVPPRKIAFKFPGLAAVLFKVDGMGADSSFNAHMFYSGYRLSATIVADPLTGSPRIKFEKRAAIPMEGYGLPGVSGGAVFDDRKLIAISTQTLSPTEEEISTLLRKEVIPNPQLLQEQAAYKKKLIKKHHELAEDIILSSFLPISECLPFLNPLIENAAIRRKNSMDETNKQNETKQAKELGEAVTAKISKVLSEISDLAKDLNKIRADKAGEANLSCHLPFIPYSAPFRGPKRWPIPTTHRKYTFLPAYGGMAPLRIRDFGKPAVAVSSTTTESHGFSFETMDTSAFIVPGIPGFN